MRLFLLLLCVWVTMGSLAQEYKDLNAYMEKYSSMWEPAWNGQPLKPFEMKTPTGETLKSEDLKGKVLVLDFWATWCAPCRKLTHDLDSLLSKYYERDFLMIGVNFQENIKKGNPEKYWQEHGYRFPMTVGCDAYGKALKTGNPTVIVVDKQGIVRGRWSGWNAFRATEVALLVEALMDEPEISLQAAVDAGRAKDYVRALYLCEAVAARNPAEGEELSGEKLRALLHLDEWKAMEFAKQWRKESGDSEAVLSDIGAGIAEAPVLAREINLFGVEVFEKLMKKYRLADNFIIYDLMGRCYFRAHEREKAIASVEKSLTLAREQYAPQETIRYLADVLKKYREE